MMRHVMKTLSLVSVAVLAACGGGVETSHEETAAQVGQGLAELALSENTITSALQTTLDTGNAKYRWTEGSLRRFDFSGSATLAQADAAVLALQEYEAYAYFGTAQALMLPVIGVGALYLRARFDGVASSGCRCESLIPQFYRQTRRVS